MGHRLSKRKYGMLAGLLGLCLVFSGAALPGGADSSSMDAASSSMVQESEAPADAVQVSFPSDFTFFLDPYEISGKGAVYSEPIMFTNNGEAPVTLRLNDLRATGEGITFQKKPIPSDSASPEREIYLLLCWDDGTQQLLTDSPMKPVEFLLQPGESRSFTVKGSITTMPEQQWQPGDVHIKAVISMAPGESAENAVITTADAVQVKLEK